MQLSPDGLQSLSHYYIQAQEIGENTAVYLRRIAEHGKMEKRIIDGCKAILRLARLLGNEKVERACSRALQGNKYNYETIKTILITGLADAPIPEQPQDPIEPNEPHSNLRGADFFENKLNQ